MCTRTSKALIEGISNAPSHIHHQAPAPSQVFEENYLGTTERSITLNFSKGAANIVAQYYQFLRLGFLGYRKIMLNLDVVRKRLRSSLGKLEHFEILSPEIGVPVVSIRLNPIKDGDGKTHTR